MNIDRFLKQFNWRFLLVRILVNALALAVTAAITPKIYFVDRSVGNWVLMALMLGVLNALLKPLLQFLTLRFIFVTYGLVVVVVNALLLRLLALIFPARFAVESFWWLLVGGLVLGLLSSFLESLLGLTMPVVPDEPPELRSQLKEQARQVAWLASAGSEEAAPLDSEAAEAPAASRLLPGHESCTSSRIYRHIYHLVDAFPNQIWYTLHTKDRATHARFLFGSDPISKAARHRAPGWIPFYGRWFGSILR
jgi:putative membrane protein